MDNEDKKASGHQVNKEKETNPSAGKGNLERNEHSSSL